MKRPRPFLRELRPLPARPADARAHAAGVAAVEAEFFPRPLADDVARGLRGRARFPRHFLATEALGA